MSRTRRNIEHAHYFARPKTKNYKKGLEKSAEELREEGYYTDKKIKQIASAWDDKLISARKEVFSKNEFFENLYLKKMEQEYYLERLTFNTFKNRFEIGTFYWKRELAVYIPFFIDYKNISYPIYPYPHLWD